MDNAAVVHLQLPALLMIHPIFHVSWVKPVQELELAPPANPVLPPA